MANTAFITSSAPGKEGVLFVGKVGITMPTNAKDPLDPGFEDMGIVRDTGVKQSIERETEDIKGYGGDVIYVLQTSAKYGFGVTVVESTNATTLKGIFGEDNVVVAADGSITLKHNKSKLGRCSVVLDHIIDQGLRRQVIEVAQITLSSEVEHTHENIVQYDLDIRTFAGSDGNNVLEYIAFTKEPNTDPAEELQVATAVLTAGKVGTAYSAKVLATGGEAPYTFTVSAGKLPAGVELAADGTLSGNPTAAGKATFTVKVADSKGATATKELSITVAA